MDFEDALKMQVRKAGYLLMIMFIIICVGIAFFLALERFTENRYVWFLAGSVYASIARMIGNEKPGEE
jgi:ascorbate-specific PTS system EIIC-type component UlaA